MTFKSGNRPVIQPKLKATHLPDWVDWMNMFIDLRDNLIRVSRTYLAKSIFSVHDHA